MTHGIHKISGTVPLEQSAPIPAGTRRPPVILQHSGRAHGEELSHSEILTRRQFVRQVQIEKRRTDRSKVPLSVLIFRVSTEQKSQPGNLGALVDLLRESKRETDLIGYLGEGHLGLLLTHTDQHGLQGFIAKFAARAAGLEYSTNFGTYPDQLFETLIAEDRDQPDTLPYFLEHDTEHGEVQLLLKRCLDIVGALVLLVASIPVMLATALAIKTTSPGPVIYTQVRLGRKGVPFRFYKFRSMTAGADDNVHRDYVANLIDGKHDEVNRGDSERPIYKLKDDVRVTRVGAFIRKTSIDELPQLFNVLKGDMSLVGPRPAFRHELERYEFWHKRKLSVRPGITCLWQVRGRNKISNFDDWVRMDLEYIDNWSLWLDFKILIWTAKAVIAGTGS